MHSLHPASYTEVARLQQSLLGRGKGTLVVNSSLQGEGSTLVSYLLALKNASAGKKTLFIDLNMRNNFLTTELHLPQQPWNLPKRQKDHSVKDLLITAETQPNLFLLPSPPDSISVNWLNEAKNIRIFLSDLETRFDHIIIDTTPVTAANRQNVDPVLLAAAAWKSVLVVLTGQTNRSKVTLTAAQLQHAGANVVGVIANDAQNPTNKEVLLHLASIFKKISPGFFDWFKYQILNANID